METLFTGHNLIELDSVASTNSYAMEHAESARYPEGTVILAHHQFVGRGQRGTGWYSQPGSGLTMSIVYYPVFLKPADQFSLNLAVCVGLAGWVRDQGVTGISIKWPNDIYAGDRKLAGILIENAISGSNLKLSVIGIGLNVNNTTFPPGIESATSLRIETQGLLNVKDCVQGICAAIEKQYLRLRAGDIKKLKEEYLMLMYRYREPAQFYIGQKFFTGVITGVTKEGKLIVNVDGRKKEYDLKEIAFA